MSISCGSAKQDQEKSLVVPPGQCRMLASSTKTATSACSTAGCCSGGGAFATAGVVAVTAGRDSESGLPISWMVRSAAPKQSHHFVAVAFVRPVAFTSDTLISDGHPNLHRHCHTIPCLSEVRVQIASVFCRILQIATWSYCHNIVCSTYRPASATAAYQPGPMSHK
eukprot:SAG22_NODE_349_length_11854_cov_8.087282_11_plen_167_part_00